MKQIILIIPYIDKEIYRKIQKSDKISNPGQKFYELLYQGLINNNMDVKIYSIVDKKFRKYLKNTDSIYYEFYNSQTYFSKVKAYKNLAKKIRINEKNKMTIIADAEAFWTLKAAIRTRKYLKSKIIAVVTDFPHDVYSYSSKRRKKTMLDKLKEVYAKQKIRTFKRADGFILLTKHMKEVVAASKPSIVIEGFSDLNLHGCSTKISKSDYKNIVYLGALNDKSGVLNLINIFMDIKNENIRLDIYGTGSHVSQILTYSKVDPRINYCGVVSLNEIIKIEQEAHFLINPRPSKQEFNKYSFPSKTIEYMSSGTPVITTKLEGIPEEYRDYLYFIDDSDSNTMKNQLIEIIDKNEFELMNTGKKAKKFVLKYKNNKIQAKKILEFISTEIENIF